VHDTKKNPPLSLRKKRRGGKKNNALLCGHKGAYRGGKRSLLSREVKACPAGRVLRGKFAPLKRERRGDFAAKEDSLTERVRGEKKKGSGGNRFAIALGGSGFNVGEAWRAQ